MTEAATAEKEEKEADHHPYFRPKDAATLILIDRSGGKPKVLVGKRHDKVVFMPGKYVFPGGYIPTLGEIVASAKSAGLRLSADPFVHESFNYATTLRHWRQRFNAAYPSLDHGRYDMRFKRLWNFYLAGSESAFDVTGFQVAQVRVEKPA